MKSISRKDADGEDPDASASPPGGRFSTRSEQQRSVETRLAILDAALYEFAAHGFEGASTRNIGKRAGIHNTLLTYHFHNKDALWRATAEHFFGEISGTLMSAPALSETMRPIDRIRREFRSFFKFTIQNPQFHHFMMRESLQGSDRLSWSMDNLLRPITDRIIPDIEAAQKDGDLPEGHPTLVYYFLLSASTVLSAQYAEISVHSSATFYEDGISEEYWKVVDEMVFGTHRETATVD